MACVPRIEGYDSVNASFAQDAFQSVIYLRLENVDPARNRWRWYVLSVQPTLFGEWSLIREWGRIGNDGGQSDITLYVSEPDALSACHTLKIAKMRRGYIAKAEQLDLPLWG